MNRRWFLLGAAALLATANVAEARMHAPYRGHRIVPAAKPLDLFTQPSAAYSFRKLRSAYAGPAVKLRRTTGGVQDIGFTANGDFDTAAATTFCNATSCFFDTFYDQSTNARHAVQATTANQPALVFNCIGTLPCVRTTTASMVLSTAGTITPGAALTMNGVARRTAGGGNCQIVAADGNLIYMDPTPNWVLLGGAGNIANSGAADNWISATGVINGAASVYRTNNTENSGTVTTSVTAGGINFMTGPGSGSCDGTEAIFWNNYALAAAERIALTQNQKDYWMPLPLDSFATPVAAWSFRKLKSTYAGPGIRLRRASDNVDQDINFLGFVPGLGSPIDTAAANAHCAATSCFIVKMYDQSGNARDVVQTVLAQQPLYQPNCIGTLPCARDTAPAGTMGLATAVGFTTGTIVSLNGVTRRDVGVNNCVVVAAGAGSGSVLYADPSVPYWILWGTTGNIVTFAYPNTWVTATGVINGAASFVNNNGNETPGTVTSGGSLGNIAFLNSGPCDGTEGMLWNNYALPAAERTALANNQRSFWGF